MARTMLGRSCPNRADKFCFLRRGIIGAVLLLSACGTVKSVEESSPDNGAHVSFNADYAHVKAATLDAVHQLKLAESSTKEEDDGFHILLNRGPSFGSWGTVGRVLVRKSATQPIDVYVVYETRLPGFHASEESLATRLAKVINEDLANGSGS